MNAAARVSGDDRGTGVGWQILCQPLAFPSFKYELLRLTLLLRIVWQI